LKLAVIGMGLMGGSAALAMKRAGTIHSVYACDMSPEAISDAISMGIAEEGGSDPAEAARTADVIMVATPVMTMESIFRQIAPVMKPDAVVTDIGSVRGMVQEGARRLGKNFPSMPPVIR